MSTQPTAVIYCDHLLYASETFIRAQASALKRFRPVYAGLRRVKGLDLPQERTHVIYAGGAAGRASELAFKLWGVAPGFLARLRSLRPQLIHAHFGADGLRALPLARRLHVPLIVTFHGSDATVIRIDKSKVPYGHRRYLANRAQLQNGAAQIIAVSQFVKRKLLDQGYADAHVQVHYIGIDTQLFSPKPAATEPTVLFVGRLVERKGVEYLIRAMAEVQRHGVDLELVVIGDGPLRTQLETLATTTLRKFQFLGIQPPEVVRDRLAKSSMFAAPSITTASGEEEGFGMVFLEAQAMEKPVVSFDSGGISEAVESGVTGFLSPERDWQALARDIQLLSLNADLCRQMGKAGRDRVLTRFNIEKQTAILEDIYFDVCDRWKTNDQIEVYAGHGES